MAGGASSVMAATRPRLFHNLQERKNETGSFGEDAGVKGYMKNKEGSVGCIGQCETRVKCVSEKRGIVPLQEAPFLHTPSL